MVWRLSGIDLILDAEYDYCKKIIAVYGFCIASGCGDLEFKQMVNCFSLSS